MQSDYTHITVILDRTGSMEQIREDTIGGFNAYLGEQKAAPGKATMTLIQFDTQDPYEVIHRFKPLREIPELTRETFVPRAMTPLFDAIGRGINDLEKSLAELGEDARPAKVAFVIDTDGLENSSREFDKPKIEKMIAEKTKKLNWQFVYLGTELEGMLEAEAIGVASSSRRHYEKTPAAVRAAWDDLSKQMLSFRVGRKSTLDFDPEDEGQPKKPDAQ